MRIIEKDRRIFPYTGNIPYAAVDSCTNPASVEVAGEYASSHVVSGAMRAIDSCYLTYCRPLLHLDSQGSQIEQFGISGTACCLRRRSGSAISLIAGAN